MPLFTEYRKYWVTILLFILSHNMADDITIMCLLLSYITALEITIKNKTFFLQLKYILDNLLSHNKHPAIDKYY